MRIDDRKYDDLRPLKMSTNYLKDVEGAVLIETGHTKVICTATIQDDVPPFLRGKNQGWVTAEYGMLPRCSSSRIKREAGRSKSGRTQEIQRLIGRTMRAIVDMEKLGERTIILDCDVIQADGGTRTASITGAFVALSDAVKKLQDKGELQENPIIDHVAAISLGIVNGQLMLDLCYEEDSNADVDMNVIMTGSGKLIEVQGTAEKAPFSREELNQMVDLAAKGIEQLVVKQKEALA